MKCFSVWFDHHEGMYEVPTLAESAEELVEAWRDDPFFLGVSPAGAGQISVGSMSARLASAEAFGHTEPD